MSEKLIQMKSRSNPIPETKKQCYFCTTNAKIIDYKDGEMLRTFMNPQAKIHARRRTGLCAAHQRKMANAVKRARIMGVVPFTIR